MDNRIQQHQTEGTGPCAGCPGAECDSPFPNVGTTDTNAVLVGGEPPFYPADFDYDVESWDLRVESDDVKHILREIELAMHTHPDTAMYLPVVRCGTGSYDERADHCLSYAVAAIGMASPDLVVLYGPRARAALAPFFGIGQDSGRFMAEETSEGRGVVQCPLMTDNDNASEYMGELRRRVKMVS